MVDRIVVHIGDSKAGSTALQTVLRYHPPNFVWAYPGTSLNHNHLARALSRPRFKHLARPRFEEIWRQIEKMDASIAVLSAELFQSVRPESLVHALKEYGPSRLLPVSVIAYCRPHLSKLTAMYSERVKFGQNVGTIGDYAAKIRQTHRLDYAPRFKAWQDCFGDDFTLRPYSPNCDIVEDFFRTSLPNTPPPGFTLRPNVSMTQPQIELMQRVPKLAKAVGISMPIPSAINRLICLHLRKSRIAAEGAKVMLSRMDSLSFQRRYFQDARKMDQLFFEDTFLKEALERSLTSPVSASRYELEASDISWFDEMVTSVLKDWSREPCAYQRRAIKTLRSSLF